MENVDCDYTAFSPVLISTGLNSRLHGARNESDRTCRFLARGDRSIVARRYRALSRIGTRVGSWAGGGAALPPTFSNDANASLISSLISTSTVAQRQKISFNAN